MARLLEQGWPSAGIFIGPAAWAVDQQANYAAVPWVCAHQVRIVPAIAAVMLVFSLAGAFLSWRGYGRAGSEAAPHAGGVPHRFVALCGIAVALLFSMVIVMHGAAGLTFHGCER